MSIIKKMQETGKMTMKRSEEQDEANRLAEKSRYSKEEVDARMTDKKQPKEMTTKTTAEVLGKVRGLLCAIASEGYYITTPKKFAEEALALLDTVQAGEEKKFDLVEAIKHAQIVELCPTCDRLVPPEDIKEQPKPETVTVEELGDIIEMAMAERSEFKVSVPREKQNHPADFYAHYLAGKFPNGLIIKGEKL